jgi:predicted ferric reductase
LFRFLCIQVFAVVNDSEALAWSSTLFGLVAPLLAATCVSTLFLTNAPLPAPKTSWINRFFAAVRSFRAEDAKYGVALSKKNQFGLGEPNYTMIAAWLVAIPNLVLFIIWVYRTPEQATGFDFMEAEDLRRRSIKRISNLSAIMGVYALAFFLIPVTRHSVLLVAMNWSPVHALRIHIWAGYTSFLFVTLHSVLHLVLWIRRSSQIPIHTQLIPSLHCWTSEFSADSACHRQIYNLTGMIAYLCFVILWATSLHWFRRKWYRVFYLFHITFGPLMILCSIWHYSMIAVYLLPSILYYLASTSPTLVQAVSSRFRGGVKIQKVVVLEDAGNVLEIHVTTDSHAHAVLTDNHPSKYIKLCVPKISVVWHPFTVFSHPNDPTTMRILFRPVGPFTKELRSHLLAPKRPVTLIDGFYRASDHCQEALRHDHVTIVTGGIGITPFISMIFTLLSAIYPVEGAPSLRSITMIWSCRELGLVNFVKEHYFDDMLNIAKSIPGFTLKLKIFCTSQKVFKFPCADVEQQSGPTSDTSENSRFESSESEEDSDEMSEGSLDALDTSPDEEHKYDPSGEYEYFESLEFSGSRWNGSSLHISQVMLLDEASMGTIENNHITPANGWKVATPERPDCDEQGHAMELARMMPGRHSKIQWNLPYFLIFTSCIWLGFHFVFAPSSWKRTSYNSMSRAIWVTLLVVEMAFTIGTVTEVVVLLFRNKWPAPKADTFDVLSSAATGRARHSEDLDAVLSVDSTSNSSIEVLPGRPGPEDILVEASLACAPGIFVCGPPALVQMARAEARKENSLLGLTRYCIYEEGFEM